MSLPKIAFMKMTLPSYSEKILITMWHAVHIRISLSSIKLRVNGEPIPYEEISCDYTNNLYSDAYFSLFQTTRSEWDSPLNLGIGYQQYKAGYCLYGFDLGTTNNDNCLDLIKTGKLSLNIKLATATTKPVTIVCYLEFSKLIELSKDGKVTTYGKTTW